MKKVLVLFVMVLGTTNMYAQDYDLEGLKKIIENADEVSSFHGGRARVFDSDGHMFYIDKKGNVVHRLDDYFETLTLDDFYSDDGLLSFSQKEFPHKKGCLDINGKIVIAPKYDGIYDFNNGIAIVLDNRKYGAIDTKGNIVIPIVYDRLGGGLGMWNGKYTIGLKGGKFGFVDKANNFYPQCFNNLPNEWKAQAVGYYLHAMSKNVDCGLYPIEKGGKWISYKITPKAKLGYHNHLGTITIPCTFDSAEMFSEGLAKVSRNGQFGYIDTKGTIVIPLQEGLKEAGAFHDGLALIKNNGKYGYIDKSGKIVIPCSFVFAQDFNEGMALVGNGTKNTYINKDGKTITNYMFDNDFIRPFSDGLALVLYQGRWGFVDKQGNTTFNTLTTTTNNNVQYTNTEVIDVTEQKPSFKGGEEQFRKWLAANVHYPELALENGIKGTVVASVVIEHDGSIGEVKIKKGVDPLLDKETIRVFKSMPKWNPGIQDGSPVRVTMDMPLIFNFSEE